MGTLAAHVGLAVGGTGGVGDIVVVVHISCRRVCEDGLGGLVHPVDMGCGQTQAQGAAKGAFPSKVTAETKAENVSRRECTRVSIPCEKTMQHFGAELSCRRARCYVGGKGLLSSHAAAP